MMTAQEEPMAPPEHLLCESVDQESVLLIN